MIARPRQIGILLAVGAVALLAQPVLAYLKIGTIVGDQVVPLRWTTQPVRYSVTSREVAGVTTSQLQVAIQNAFQTWAQVNSAAVQIAQFAGFTSLEPSITDGQSVLGFQSRSDLDRVLASTSFQTSNSGELLSADIFFNTKFAWSVSQNGDSSAFDVQSIATHEIGHFFGLYHSMLGETELPSDGGRRVIAKASVMFPIAFPPGNISDRTLKADDVAGISDIYASGSFRQETGSISGRVTLRGTGIFGAHIIAVHQTTGAIIGGFSLDTQGRFVIAGLKPGIYIVRAEPMDDADVTSFFNSDAPVELNFKVTYLDRLVAVPAAGSSAPVEIKVTPK